jgi:RHS repeat-associated protein
MSAISSRVAVSRHLVAAGMLLWAALPAGAQQTTIWNYQYDANGNRTQITDPLSHVTTFQYDALNRLINTVQPIPQTGGTNPQIGMTYDGQSQLAKVTDPRSLATTYTVDGLGNTGTLASPDTGTATSVFDPAGDLTSRTDAKNKKATYTYDALNRLTGISYPTGTGTSFTYDQGANAIGKLTKITDESGNTTYAYDGFERLSSKTQTAIQGTSQWARTVTYGYGTAGSANGRLVSITYPSANRINYAYDAAGRISAITLNPTNSNGVGTNTGVTVNLVSSITYSSFAAPLTWKWGATNSTDTVTRTYDVDGRLTGYPLGNGSQSGLVRTVVYDSASRITQFTHVNGSGVSQPTFNHTFNYDNLDRLTGWGQNTTAYGYGYDNTGNRTSYQPGATNYTDTIASTSNRLSSTTGPSPARNNTYDADGHVTADGTYTYTYSDRGRLASVKAGTNTINYLYNGLEQRILKTGPTSIVSTGTQVYVYDEASHLLGEYNNTLAVVEETVFLGDAPIIVLTQTVSGSPATTTTNVYNVYTDQIGAPRVITQASSFKMAWRWDSTDPFGVLSPNTNPAGLGTFTYNPRMPGQLYDSETAQFYNINRNYDPVLGRYVQADPIGLRGGVNELLSNLVYGRLIRRRSCWADFSG